MPQWELTNNETGDTLTIEADQQPSQDDIHEIFQKHGPQPEEPTPRFPKINLSPYEQQILNLGYRPESGMEAGTELTTAVGRDLAKAGSAAVDFFRPPAPPTQEQIAAAGLTGKEPPNAPGMGFLETLSTPAGEVLGEGPRQAIRDVISGPVGLTVKRAEALLPKSKVVQAAAGVEESVTDMAEFFTSPLGVSTLGTGALPRIAQRGVALAFATQMASDVPDIFKQLGDEFGKPADQRDMKKIARLTSSALLDVGFSGLAGAHGLKPERITSAAFRDENGTTFVGPNHPAILDKFGIEGFDTRESRNTEQFGYWTDSDRFVNRDKGAKIARRARQQIEEFDIDPVTGKEQAHSDEISAAPGGDQPLGDSKQPVKEKGTTDAEGIRRDTGQPQAPGPLGEGVQAYSGGDIQQAPPGAPAPAAQEAPPGPAGGEVVLKSGEKVPTDPVAAMDWLKNNDMAKLTGERFKYGPSFTAWAHEVGSRAKTAADLEALKNAWEYFGAKKDPFKAQAAHEAYNAATGERLDGKPAPPEYGAIGSMRKFEPDYQPPMPPKGKIVPLSEKPENIGKRGALGVAGGAEEWEDIKKRWKEIMPGMVEALVKDYGIPRKQAENHLKAWFAKMSKLPPGQVPSERPDVLASVPAAEKGEPEVITLPRVNAPEGYRGKPSAEVKVRQMPDGTWRSSISFYTEQAEHKHGSARIGETYETRQDAINAAIAEARRALKKFYNMGPRKEVMQEMAHIEKWLDWLSGGAPEGTPAPEPVKVPFTPKPKAPTTERVDLSDLSPKLRDFYNLLKKVTNEYSGIDASHLSPAEREKLADKGIRFFETKDGKMAALYPGAERAKDRAHEGKERRKRAEKPPAAAPPPTPPTPPPTPPPAPGEPPKSRTPPSIYGIARRIRDQRARAGQVGHVPPGEAISPAEQVELGRQELKRDPQAGINALDEWESSERKAVSDYAFRVTRAHGESLVRAADRAKDKYGLDSPQYKKAYAELTRWDERLRPLQTAWAAGGHAQQGMTDVDTLSFTSIKKTIEKESGEPMTPEQVKEAEAKIEALNKAREGVEESEGKIPRTFRQVGAGPQKPKSQWPPRSLKALLKVASPELIAELKAAWERSPAEKDAYDAVNKTVTRWQSDLAKAESKARAKVLTDKTDLAKIELRRVQRVQDLLQKWDRQNAIAAAKAEREEMARGLHERVLRKAWEYINEGPPRDPKEPFSPKTPMENLRDIREKLGIAFGLTTRQVTALLAKNPQTKFVMDEVWRKKNTYRILQQQAKRWVWQQAQPRYERWLKEVPRAFFGVKVAGHGMVALGTHAPALAFDPRFWKIYGQAYKDMVHMNFSAPFYEQMMNDLTRRGTTVINPETGAPEKLPGYYDVGQRAGLQTSPDMPDEYSDPGLNRWLTRTGSRGYGILKVLRQDLFDHHWDRLPKEMRTDDMARVIAADVNHITGVTEKSAKPWVATLLFAPRLLASRAMVLVGDPLKAIRTGTKAALGGKITPAEKWQAMEQFKSKLLIGTTYMSLLAANQGLLKLFGSDQDINFTDPNKHDFLRFKMGGQKIGYGSAMLSMAQLVPEMISAVKNDRKLNRIIFEFENLGKTLGGWARTQASPFLSTMLDLGTGRDWQDRPLPRAGFGLLPGKTAMPKRLRERGIGPYTWGSWAAETQLPIPFEEGIKDVVDNYQGWNEDTWKNMGAGLASLLLGITTGARVAEDVKPPPFHPREAM